MGLKQQRGPRYRPREAYAVRPTSAVAAEDPFARTALDPPRFTDSFVAEPAPPPQHVPSAAAPTRGGWWSLPLGRVALAAAAGLVAGTACALSFWLAAFGGWQ